MRNAARFLLSPEMAMLALTLLALVGLPVALRVLAPDAAWTLLLPVALVGVVGGFILQAPALRNLHAAAIYLAMGALLLFVRISQLGEILWAGTQQTARILALVLLPSPAPGTELRALTNWVTIQSQGFESAASFTLRVAGWLSQALRGSPGEDLAARAFCLALGLWLLVGWSCWRVWAHGDPLGGLLPVTALLAITLNLSTQNRWPLWLHLSALFLLLLVSNLHRLTSTWQRSRIDYSDSVIEDSTVSAVLVISLLLVAGYSASVFSLQDLLDRIRRPAEPEASSNVSSSGGPSSGRISSGANSGLQITHVISAAPSLSEDVLMYIKTGDLPPMPSSVGIDAPYYHWRGATYQTYSGRGWNNPVTAFSQLSPHDRLISGSSIQYRSIHAAVTIPAGIDGGAYWTGALVAADKPLEVVGRGPPNAAASTTDPWAGIDLVGAIITEPDSAAQMYTFDSLLPTVDEAALRAAPTAYPAWVADRYLQLPAIVPERVRALARDITAQAATPYDRALAIETYLRKIPYSLEVPAPPSGREATDYFLFDLKKGYCDYYATAMAVMARAVGLPTRLVLGYASGGYDTYLAQYVVRKADAHAWAEVYFTGIGWVEFEPTTGQPAPEREHQALPPPKTEAPSQSAWYVLPTMVPTDWKLAWWSLAVAAMIYACWLGIDWMRLRHLAPENAAHRAYQRLRRLTRRLAGAPPAGETALEHLHAVTARLAVLVGQNRLLIAFAQPILFGLTEATELHMRSLFAPAPLTAAEGRRAVTIWVGLRWRLRLLNLLLAIRPFASLRARTPSSSPRAPAP